MDDLLLNQQTRKNLQQMCKQPPHAILLSGADGSGKNYVAKRLAEQILNVTAEGLNNYSYFFVLKPEKDSIGIESIRRLHTFLHLRTTGKSKSIRRMAIIENAQTLTVEAQNSLLKILEEPPEDTVILLTAVQSQNILATIYSRTRHVVILPPTMPEAHNYFSTIASSAQIDKAYTLSSGEVGLMCMLLRDDTNYPLLASIENAKTMLGQTAYERLAQIDALAKDKSTVAPLLNALKRIAKVGLSQASTKDNMQGTKRWHSILKHIHIAEKMHSQNVNTKLLLTNLLLNM